MFYTDSSWVGIDLLGWFCSKIGDIVEISSPPEMLKNVRVTVCRLYLSSFIDTIV